MRGLVEPRWRLANGQGDDRGDGGEADKDTLQGRGDAVAARARGCHLLHTEASVLSWKGELAEEQEKCRAWILERRTSAARRYIYCGRRTTTAGVVG